MLVRTFEGSHPLLPVHRSRPKPIHVLRDTTMGALLRVECRLCSPRGAAGVTSLRLPVRDPLTFVPEELLSDLFRAARARQL
jgi:hypothetical protein